jgi:hypothetical protein
MEIMRNRLLLLLVLSLAVITGYSQEKEGRESRKEEQAGKQEQTAMLVNNREFVFHARRALPSRGSPVDLTSNPGFVKFEPDLIESSMPFFGRAYSGIGYGEGAGLRFKGEPEEFTVEKKRRNYQISATVKDGTDAYTLFLTVASDGTGSLTITSNNRETISYSGEIRAAPPGSAR